MAASVIAGAAFLIGPSAALADPPFGNLFKRGTAGHSAPAVQELRPEHGPWLIFASSFEGSNAKTKAYELANDLQKDFGLTTFVMPKKFDFTELVPGSGIREDGRQKVMKYRDSKVKEGYAVLVGELRVAGLANFILFRPFDSIYNGGSLSSWAESASSYRHS
jgi:hypothetical protein